MENKRSPSKKKLLSIKEEKLIRQCDYDYPKFTTRLPKKQLLLDLEILKRHPTQRQASQRVLVSIKSRAAPAIKTIYIAEKSRFYSRKSSEKTGSRLGIGDHSSFNTHLSDNVSLIPSITNVSDKDIKSSIRSLKQSEVSYCDSNSDTKSSDTGSLTPQFNVYKTKQRSAEKCYVYTQPQINMNIPKIETRVKDSKVGGPNKVDIGVFVANLSSDVSLQFSPSLIDKLHKRVDNLERKILRQEMVFRSLDPNIQLSSSDEECHGRKMRTSSGPARPGCSYIQQYSHVPETSAFQRYNQNSTLSPSRATTLEKEHNSEQYGRDFTAYDGITARGRRQSASVPCKRDDFPKMAAERVHKIRHKLNPVRDYRLMDTVHYLAQGEFAPRDDGIKLTPSREAVLSDIIWEDVCRTHWPNARLGRRQGQPERCSTRCELQRLIDSLLRERVAHVERRRRRHYRIVKLNHRHESCRPVGKTGDIIVASHKKKDCSDDRDIHISDHNAASAIMSDRRREEQNFLRRSHRSHDRLMYQEARQKRRFRQEECTPGPSYAATRSPTIREPTCCYQTSSPIKSRTAYKVSNNARAFAQDLTSASSSTSKHASKSPRLVIKKDASYRKTKQNEPDLEQYILLPTLVIRTPSNVRRQKKFNELYHRILNVQLNNAECAVESEAADRNPNANPNCNKKDIGLNINITLSGSEEKLNMKQTKMT